MVTMDATNCSADNEEVNCCLPVQQCTENNSVNSAKICAKKVMPVSQKPGIAFLFLPAFGTMIIP